MSSGELWFPCRVQRVRIRPKIMIERDVLLENDDEVFNRGSGVRCWWQVYRCCRCGPHQQTPQSQYGYNRTKKLPYNNILHQRAKCTHYKALHFSIKTLPSPGMFLSIAV